MNSRAKALSAVLAASILASVTMVPAVAQTADTATAERERAVEQNDDDGFDWGLLGLLGLLGLIPRKRHDTHVHHDTTRTTNR